MDEEDASEDVGYGTYDMEEEEEEGTKTGGVKEVILNDYTITGLLVCMNFEVLKRYMYANNLLVFLNCNSLVQKQEKKEEKEKGEEKPTFAATAAAAIREPC